MDKIKRKEYFEELDKIENRFHKAVYRLEKRMEKETGISGIEFFWCDNEIVGIGNVGRTMKLIHRHYSGML